MSKYKTKKINFDNCHPVIAEHLKRGEAILCKAWGDGRTGNEFKVWVDGFRQKSTRPYRTNCFSYLNAEPIEIKQRVKKASKIVKWLEDNGYVLNTINEYIHPKTNDGYVLAIVLQLCGKEYDKKNNLPEEWLEDIPHDLSKVQNS